MPTKIFVPNRGTHNHSKLAAYGEVVFVTTGAIQYDQTSRLADAWARALAGSQPSDWIVPAGPSTLNMLGATMFAAMHGTLNLLIYKDGNYVKRQMAVDGLVAMIAEARDAR